VAHDSSPIPVLDAAWLDGLGYSALDELQKHQVLRAVGSAIEHKVGTVLSKNLPDDLINQFESITNHPQREVSDALAANFLRDHIPGYGDTVKAIFQQLTEELRQIRVDFDEIQRTHERPPGIPSVSDMSDQQFIDNVQDESYSTGQQIQGGPDL
jgi:hypothetical protein